LATYPDPSTNKQINYFLGYPRITAKTALYTTTALLYKKHRREFGTKEFLWQKIDKSQGDYP
jgi:hypothetical protein